MREISPDPIVYQRPAVQHCDVNNHTAVRNVDQCVKVEQPKEFGQLLGTENTFKSITELEINRIISLNSYVHERIKASDEESTYVGNDDISNYSPCDSCLSAFNCIVGLCNICDSFENICEQCHFNFGQITQNCVNSCDTPEHMDVNQFSGASEKTCSNGLTESTCAKGIPESNDSSHESLHAGHEINDYMSVGEPDVLFDAIRGFD